MRENSVAWGEAGGGHAYLSKSAVMPPREPSLSNEQRHALALLARLPHGLTEELLVLAHGLDRAMIADLVHEGVATKEREIVTGPGRAAIEVVRIRSLMRGGWCLGLTAIAASA